MQNENLSRLATLYYIDGLTQEELSRMFSISRATIGRMLRRALREGIVEIRVRPNNALASDLEKALIERFGIKRALISVDHKDQDKQRALLAGLVASHLEQILTDGSVIAVGMGRNVSAVSEYALSATRRQCTFVSAIGGAYRGGQTMNADHIARRLAARFGGESESLYAPALVNDPQIRLKLIENDTVSHTLDKARRADVALVGIGDMSESEESNIVRMGWFSPEEIAQAKKAGTVGDVMGYDFIDIRGQPSALSMQERVIGLNLQELKQIANVIAIASEPTKISGILGALNAGVVDTLATTSSNAISVLNFDEALRRSASVSGEISSWKIRPE